jgi:hypothetical protein
MTRYRDNSSIYVAGRAGFVYVGGGAPVGRCCGPGSTDVDRRAATGSSTCARVRDAMGLLEWLALHGERQWLTT